MADEANEQLNMSANHANEDLGEDTRPHEDVLVSVTEAQASVCSNIISEL
jgi:hypothetical protein